MIDINIINDAKEGNKQVFKDGHYHNDRLQMNSVRLVFIFVVNLCSPFGLLLVCLLVTIKAYKIWPLLHKNEVSRSTQGGHDDGDHSHDDCKEHLDDGRVRIRIEKRHGFSKLWKEVFKRNYLAHQSAEHYVSATVSSLLNVGLLIWIVSGDFSRVYLMELLLPRWLMIGVVLSEAMEYEMRSTDDLDSETEVRDALEGILESRFQKNIRKLLNSPDTEDTIPDNICFGTKSPTCFSYTFFGENGEEEAAGKNLPEPKEAMNQIADEAAGENLPEPKVAMNQIADVICPKWIRATPLSFPVRIWREWQVLRGVKHLSKMAKGDERQLSRTTSTYNCCLDSLSRCLNSLIQRRNTLAEELTDLQKKKHMWIYLNEVIVDMTRLELALADVAHEPLLRHFERIFLSKIKLPFTLPFEKSKDSEQEKPDQATRRQQRLTDLVNVGSMYLTQTTLDEDSFLERLSATEHKLSFLYKQALENESVPVYVLADQLLLGGVVPTSSLYYVKVAAECIVNAVGVALMVFAAVLPAVVRDQQHAPQTVGDFVVMISFMMFVFVNGSMMALWYPTQLRNLFSNMSQSLKMFNAMLMGGKAAAANLLPHVRVGNFDDITGWYLLYSFFIAYVERRKLALEVGFGHGVLTVIGTSVLLLLQLILRRDDENWNPGVDFGETFIFLIAFIIFSLPPLLFGLRANLLSRETVDLLWGHATESWAHLHKLERELTNLKEEKEKLEKEQQDEPQQDEIQKNLEEKKKDNLKELKDKEIEMKSAMAAIQLTESIAQRTRLDTALVVRTLGMELTVGQFTAIASLCSTAGIYAYNKIQEMKQQGTLPEALKRFF